MKTVFKYRVLVIDDDKEMRTSLIHLLESSGWEIETASSAVGIESLIETTLPDVILTDVQMPKRTGLELLIDLSNEVMPPIVLISAHGDIPMAVDAIQKGAYGFLEKPFEPRRLLTILKHAAEQHQLKETTSRLKARLADLSGLNRVFIGQSDLVNSVREKVLDYSQIDTSVLIIGETGTGKEVIAKAMHDLSLRSTKPFIAVNCTAIPINDFDEMLFGRKGIIKGLVKKAQGGTLFLDEIIAAPIEIQMKLLRLLETKEYLSLGSDVTEKADIKIIAASSEDPDTAIKEDRLRKDLFFRLNGFMVLLPSLREHKDDIIFLFENFILEFSRLYEIESNIQSAEDLAVLLSYYWPGNVRELRSVAERSVLATRRGGGGISNAIHGSEIMEDMPDNLRGALAAFEHALIAKAIKSNNGKMDKVAEALGIGRRTLNEKIVKLDLDKEAILTSAESRRL